MELPTNVDQAKGLLYEGYPATAAEWAFREIDRLKSALSAAEKERDQLKERAKGLAMMVDAISDHLDTVKVDENETDVARITLFDIGCLIATFGERPENILDVNRIVEAETALSAAEERAKKAEKERDELRDALLLTGCHDLFCTQFSISHRPQSFWYKGQQKGK